MKKKIIYLIFCIGVLFFASCENTDYQVYDKNQKNKLFFESDTVRFTYGLTMDKETDLQVKVKLIGMVDQEKDCAYRIKVVADQTTAVAGEHYAIPETTVFPKDSVSAMLALDFKKAALEKNVEYTLVLRLEENDYYSPTDRKECTILFSNKDIEAPVWWQSGKLGPYNQEKLILFVDFYHKSAELSPVLYANIKSTWGENLDQGTATNLLTIYKYQGYLNKYILTPMYEYFLSSGDANYEIPNPNN